MSRYTGVTFDGLRLAEYGYKYALGLLGPHECALVENLWADNPAARPGLSLGEYFARIPHRGQS